MEHRASERFLSFPHTMGANNKQRTNNRISALERTAAQATGAYLREDSSPGYWGLQYISLAKSFDFAVFKPQNVFPQKLPNMCNVSSKGENQIRLTYCDQTKRGLLMQTDRCLIQVSYLFCYSVPYMNPH